MFPLLHRRRRRRRRYLLTMISDIGQIIYLAFSTKQNKKKKKTLHSKFYVNVMSSVKHYIFSRLATILFISIDIYDI